MCKFALTMMRRHDLSSYTVTRMMVLSHLTDVILQLVAFSILVANHLSSKFGGVLYPCLWTEISVSLILIVVTCLAVGLRREEVNMLTAWLFIVGIGQIGTFSSFLLYVVAVAEIAQKTEGIFDSPVFIFTLMAQCINFLVVVLVNLFCWRTAFRWFMLAKSRKRTFVDIEE